MPHNEFPIELSATGSSISLPYKIFSFGIASLLSGQTPDFRKAAMACLRRTIYSDPQQALLVKAGKLFFVGFAGDFLYNTFLHFLSIQLLQGHKRQHQKAVGYAKYVEEVIRLKYCFLLLSDRSRTSCVNHVRHIAGLQVCLLSTP